MPYIVNEQGGYAVCDGCGERMREGQTKTVVFPRELAEGERIDATECEHYHPRCARTKYGRPVA